MRLHQQPKHRQFSEQPLGPAGTRHHRRQLAHPAGQTRRLRIHESRRHRIETPVRIRLRTGQAAAHLVIEPHLELVQTAGDAEFSLLCSAGRTFGIFRFRSDRTGRRRGGFRYALVYPRSGKVCDLRFFGHTARSPEQHQPERMFARELPRRAGALVGRTAQIDDRLVRISAAASAEPPHHLVGAALRGPRRRYGEFPTRGLRTRIRGERQYLLGPPSLCAHTSNQPQSPDNRIDREFRGSWRPHGMSDTWPSACPPPLSNRPSSRPVRTARCRARCA